MKCHCERCQRVVVRPRRSVLRVALYVLSYLATLPFAWLLFVAGPGVLGVIPIVLALGFAGEMSLRPWVFPERRCPHCAATLELESDRAHSRAREGSAKESEASTSLG